MKNTVILLISIATFIACTKQKVKQVSTIDSTLQVSVDSILQESGLVRTASLLAALETKAVKLSNCYYCWIIGFSIYVFTLNRSMV